MFRFTQIQLLKKTAKSSNFTAEFKHFSTMPRTATIETTMGTFKVELYTEVIEENEIYRCTVILQKDFML